MNNRRILIIEFIFFIVILFTSSIFYELHLRNNYFEECYSESYSTTLSDWEKYSEEECLETIEELSSSNLENLTNYYLTNYPDKDPSWIEENILDMISISKNESIQECIENSNRVFFEEEIPSMLSENCKLKSKIHYQINILTILKWKYILSSMLLIILLHFLLKIWIFNKLKKEVELEKENEIYECEKCGKEFESEEEAEKHEKRCKGKKSKSSI